MQSKVLIPVFKKGKMAYDLNLDVFYEYGGIAIHSPIYPAKRNWFSITHIATGMAMGNVYGLKKAKTFVHTFNELLDFDKLKVDLARPLNERILYDGLSMPYSGLYELAIMVMRVCDIKMFNFAVDCRSAAV